MKMFLTAFGLHNPSASAPLPAHAIIPVALDCDGGIDLDYSTLLLAESFIMDKAAYEYVLSQQAPHMAPMARTLEILKNAGLLEAVDYGALLVPHEEKISEKTSRLVEHVEPWIPIARRQWGSVREEFLDFHRRYGSQDAQVLDTTHYGVSCLLHNRSKERDPQEIKRLEALLESRRKRLTVAELDDFREIVRPLVAQVVSNNLLRTLLHAPFVDWDDAQDFYHQLDIGHWTGLDLEGDTYDDAALISQARCLFSIVIPELIPKRAEDVVDFIKTKRAVVSLRKELWGLLKEGKPVSREWLIQMQSEATRAKLRSENRGRIVKWVGRIAGLAIPGANAVVDVLGDAAVAGAEEVSSRTWEDRPNVKYEWYYALQRLAMKQSR